MYATSSGPTARWAAPISASPTVELESRSWSNVTDTSTQPTGAAAHPTRAGARLAVAQTLPAADDELAGRVARGDLVQQVRQGATSRLDPLWHHAESISTVPGRKLQECRVVRARSRRGGVLDSAARGALP